MKKEDRQKTYMVNKSSDQKKKGGLKETVMAAVNGMLPSASKSEFPLSRDWKENQKAQLQLISYFAEEYEAKPHNKKWFLNRYDLDHKGLSDLYDHYQQNRTALQKQGVPLFSVYLFKKLQEEAQDLSAQQEQPYVAEKMQDMISVYFHAARYHAHSKALWNGKGTTEKQRDHAKAASSAFENAVSKLPESEQRDKLKEKLKSTGYPNAKFSVAIEIEAYQNNKYKAPLPDSNKGRFKPYIL